MNSDLKLSVTPPARLYQECNDFLRFLRTAAQKHSVTISFSADDAGMYEVCVPGKECWNLDSFLQEIVLHRGLYYYLCGVPNRKEVAKYVVAPIFESLRASRFRVSYPVQIHRHLLTGAPHWAGGDLVEQEAHEFELLFQKLNLKEISGWDFVLHTDDLLTEWMLGQLNHPKGVQSPAFTSLLGMCARQNILRTKEVRRLFDKVHSMRTRGLHRLEREIPDADIAKIAQDIYSVFEWIDDYWQAQSEKTVRLSGKRYRRIRFGKEYLLKGMSSEFTTVWHELMERPCGDCGVIAGELHLEGCDIEVCPRCRGQFWGCPCKTDEDFDYDNRREK
jgi:hypothetical protein